MKILSMPAGAAKPANLYGHITNSTVSGYYLADGTNTYNPVDLGGGTNVLSVPNALEMLYIGGARWTVTSSYDCTVVITNPSTTYNVTAGTPVTIGPVNYPLDIAITFI